MMYLFKTAWGFVVIGNCLAITPGRYIEKGRRPGAIPAWGNAPGKRVLLVMQGLKARSIKFMERAFSPSSFCLSMILGLRPRLV